MKKKSIDHAVKTFDHKNFFSFLKKSPSAFHAVKTLKQELTQAGFEEIFENNPWNLKEGKKYFTTKGSSTLIAFIMPNKAIKSSITIASHVDSPSLKLKPNADYVANNMAMLGTEIYGGPLYSSWLNRDLGIAGEVSFINKDNKIQRELIDISDTPFIIPQLAIHIDREVNEKGLVLNPQEHLNAIAGFQEEGDEKPFLKTLLLNELKAKEILSFDLFFYPLEEPRLAGKDLSLISAFKIDNLASVYCSLIALKNATASQDHLKLSFFFDHEEFGSKSNLGADSDIVGETLSRIYMDKTKSIEDFLIFKAQSLLASIDLSHAVHPNYLNKHEPRHGLKLNGGVIIKSNANGKYATSSRSASLIAYLCTKHHIPLQRFVGRSDIPCGSTVGPHLAATTGIKTVDLGLSQLSMHSTRELMGKDDMQYLTHLLNELLNDEASYHLCNLD
jgi:aspartyl aminopeptidase